MRRTVKQVLVGAAVVGIVAASAPAASAAGPSITGGCFLVAGSNNTATNGQNQGFVGGASRTSTGATLTCWIQVNGVDAPGTRFSYPGSNGVQAGAWQVSYTASNTDTVTECQSVAYDDGTTTPTTCTAVTTTQVPPQAVIDSVRTLIVTAELPFCPVLQSLAGNYGPVTITSDGDVYAPDPLGLGYDPIADCPPLGPGGGLPSITSTTLTLEVPPTS